MKFILEFFIFYIFIIIWSLILLILFKNINKKYIKVVKYYDDNKIIIIRNLRSWFKVFSIWKEINCLFRKYFLFFFSEIEISFFYLYEKSES